MVNWEKSKNFQNLEKGPKRSEMWWNAFLSRLEVWIRPKKFFPSSFPRRFDLEKIAKSKKFSKSWKWSKTFRNVMKRISIEVRGLNSAKKLFPFFFPRRFDLEKIGKIEKFQNLENGPKRSEMWWNAFLSRLEVWIRPKTISILLPKEVWLRKNWKIEKFSKSSKWFKTFRNVMKRNSIEVRGMTSTEKIVPLVKTWGFWGTSIFFQDPKNPQSFPSEMKHICNEVGVLKTMKIQHLFWQVSGNVWSKKFQKFELGQSKDFQNCEKNPDLTN